MRPLTEDERRCLGHLLQLLRDNEDAVVGCSHCERGLRLLRELVDGSFE